MEERLAILAVDKIGISLANTTSELSFFLPQTLYECGGS
jgi:hypothetical protein